MSGRSPVHPIGRQGPCSGRGLKESRGRVSTGTRSGRSLKRLVPRGMGSAPRGRGSRASCVSVTQGNRRGQGGCVL